MPGQAIRGLNLTGDEDSVDMEGNHLYHILDGGKHGAELEINVCIPPLFPMRPVRGIRSLGIRSEAWCLPGVFAWLPHGAQAGYP